MPNLDGALSSFSLSLLPSRAHTDLPHSSFAGVSATSMIRQFDATTPIVSMTSNSGPHDVMTYFSHGQSTYVHSR